jgi:hypothetical protein
MKSIVIALLALAWGSTFAQGTFLYTWHGSQNLFQATFQVPAYENQPGQYFEDGTFRSTFTVLSPDATYPPSTFSSGDDASGFGPPLQLSVTMQNTGTGTGVHASSAGPSFYFISEYLLATPSVVTSWEQGYWTFAPIPEPNALGITAVGLAALRLRKLKPCGILVQGVSPAH